MVHLDEHINRYSNSIPGKSAWWWGNGVRQILLHVHFFQICIHGRPATLQLAESAGVFTFSLVVPDLSGWVILKIHFLPSINKTLINVLILMFEQCRMFWHSNKGICALGKVILCLFKVIAEQFMKMYGKGVGTFYLTLFSSPEIT